MTFAALSAAAFLLYGLDKLKAKMDAWRIAEKTLLGLSFIGGAAGGLLAMLLFRHKTRHWYFFAINILSLAFHAAVLIILKVKGI